MEERTYDVIRRLPREDLEAFAVRAAVYVRESKSEADAGGYFVAILTGFLLGALVASSGFLLGASLG